jgi:hypothetical protein
VTVAEDRPVLLPAAEAHGHWVRGDEALCGTPLKGVSATEMDCEACDRIERREAEVREYAVRWLARRTEAGNRLGATSYLLGFCKPHSLGVAPPDDE